MARPSLNLIQIIGNLGSDPEIRYTANGREVANFSVATTESWRDKDAGYQERTEWFRVVAWGKLAIVCGEHLAKGRTVYVQGKMQSRKCEGRDGQERVAWEIQAHSVQFLDKPESTSQPRRDDDDEPFERSPAKPDDNEDVPF